MSAESRSEASSPRATGRPRPFETILLGGAAVAVLDIANAMIFWALYRGTPPRVILQSVAAGLQGKEALSGGAASALLGALLHLFIACGVAAAYWAACMIWPAIIQRPFLFGALHGGLVYLVMNFVVLPLSQAPPGTFRPAWFLDNFIGHLLLVGPPAALIARWSASRNRD